MAGATRPPAPVDRRYFIAVETDFFDHPKTLLIGRELAFAVLASWAYCHKQLTDGVLPEQVAKQILPHKRDRDRLVKHGWWDEAKAGYLIHDYLRHQPSRNEMRRKSDAARNAAGIRWSTKAGATQHAGTHEDDPPGGSEGHPQRHAERNATRNAKGNASGNAERNARGNAERHAESMQSQSQSENQTYPASVAIATVPPAREAEPPIPDVEPDHGAADRSRDRGTRAVPHVSAHMGKALGHLRAAR